MNVLKQDEKPFRAKIIPIIRATNRKRQFAVIDSKYHISQCCQRLDESPQSRPLARARESLWSLRRDKKADCFSPRRFPCCDFEMVAFGSAVAGLVVAGTFLLLQGDASSTTERHNFRFCERICLRYRVATVERRQQAPNIEVNRMFLLNQAVSA